uniref:U3 small nucleolar RNA-associated protein 13 C-terminal domain-containing protein n=1 Tax=Panagrolaimus sp. JU765 TaxID=591449 RepID=A0AC34QNC5_9BILA
MPNLIEYKKERTIGVFYTGGDVLISKDGSTLFTACLNVVKAVKASNGETKYEIGDKAGDQSVTCFALAKDDSIMVIAYRNDLIQFYSLLGDDAAMTKQFRGMHIGPILLTRFSPNGECLATGGADGCAKIFNIKTNTCIKSFKGPTVISSLNYLDEKTLIVGYANGAVRVYDLTEPDDIIEITLHSSYVGAVLSFVYDNHKDIVIVSRDKTYSIFDLKTRQKVKVYPIFEVVEDGVIFEKNKLVTVGEEGVIKIFNVMTGKKLAARKISSQRIDTILKISSQRIDTILYSQELLSFLCITADQNIIIVDQHTLAIKKQFAGFNDEVYSACPVTPNETDKHFVFATNSSDLRLYNMADWSCQLIPGHTECALAVDSPRWNRHIFASGSKDTQILLWKLFDAEVKTELTTGDVADNVEQPVVLKQIAIGTGHTSDVSDVKFCHSEKNSPFFVSVSCDNTVKLWSINNLLENQEDDDEPEKLKASATMVAHKEDITCLEISPNDKLCATGSMDKTVRLWHIDRQVMKLGIAGTLSGHRRPVWKVKFSTHEQTVASCSSDGTIKIFSLLDKSCLKTLEGHAKPVTALEYVAHGTKLVSGDGSGILKLWDVATGVCDKTVEVQDERIWDIVAVEQEDGVPPNLLTIGGDGNIIYWKDATEELKVQIARDEAKKLAQIQTLSNFIDQGRFAEALVFAIDLKQPYNCLKVVNKIVEQRDREKFGQIIKGLSPEQLTTLIDYSSQWNTNTKTYYAAQEVLNVLLRSIHPDKLMQLPAIGKILQTFLPYTNRHLERLNNLDINTHYLAYLHSAARI